MKQFFYNQKLVEITNEDKQAAIKTLFFKHLNYLT